jgi:hypothetical protein
MLTKKIDKTHKIVPVKRSKGRVKSTKWLGWDFVTPENSITIKYC